MTDSLTEDFDWDAFMRDTFDASAAATGAWLRCLYKMRLSVTRGRITRPILGYARLFGTTPDQAKALIAEITAFGIGDAETEANGDITLTNRRLYREWKEKEDNRIRQLRFQQNKRAEENNGDITGHNANITLQESQTPPLSSSSLTSSVPKEEVNTERNKTKKDVEDVFAYWQSMLNHPQAKLITIRRNAIAGRLKDGYSVEDLKRAVNGCKASDWNMGINDRGKKFDDIELICRNGTKVEQFIGYLDAKPRSNGKPRPDMLVGKNDPAAAEIVRPVPCEICGDEFCLRDHADERRSSHA